jgi:hypothetical protein
MRKLKPGPKPSGKITVQFRLFPSTKEYLIKKAHADGRTMSETMERIIKAHSSKKRAA